MQACFWNLCHCPDATPCVEHSGSGCSNLNGKNITKESDVSDAVTGAISVAIATLEGEKAAAEQARKKMDDTRKEIQKDHDDLEALIKNASDRASRRGVSEKYDELLKKHQNTIQELGDALNRYDRIVQYPIGQIGRTEPLLIIPYSDSTGYCACYDEKGKRLAAVAAALTADQAYLAVLAGDMLTIRQTVRNYYKYAATIVVVAGGALAWFFYIYIGLPFFSMGTLLIVMAVAAILAELVMSLLLIEHQIAATQILILKLMLQYYQSQSIPTCKKPAPQPPATGSGWWEDLKKMIEDILKPAEEPAEKPH
jgi:hypothetical protein